MRRNVPTHSQRAVRRREPLPALPPCVHYAGSEKFIRKALALQAERGPVFDISCDCEDGAPVGSERAHAATMARADRRRRQSPLARRRARARRPSSARGRPKWTCSLDGAGDRIAFLTLPKAERAGDVERFLAHVADRAAHARPRARTIPVSVLIETPGAVHDAWAIAALPGVVSLDFGLMDFVSAHHGAIPLAAMASPGPVRASARAPREVPRSPLPRSRTASCPRTTSRARSTNPPPSFADARRARDEFGYLRMWSIHPSQIEPIVDAMRPRPPGSREGAGDPRRGAGRRLGAAAHRRRAARPRVVSLLLELAAARARRRRPVARQLPSAFFA